MFFIDLQTVMNFYTRPELISIRGMSPTCPQLHNSCIKHCCLLPDPEAGFEQYRVAEKAHGSWMKRYLEGNTSEVLTNMGKKILKQYFEALSAMSSALSKQLGKYDLYSMIAGMVLVFQVSNHFFFSSGIV